jgi:hypothetical protein
MSTLHHEKPSQSPVRNFLDWCRAQLKSESEFGCCCDAEIERMARDIRMSASEFRAAASRGPKSADLLMRRMAALDLDPNEVGRIEPAAFRDLQRVCTLCNSRRAAQGILRATLQPQPGIVTARTAIRWRRSAERPGARDRSGSGAWPKTKSWEERECEAANTAHRVKCNRYLPSGADSSKSYAGSAWTMRRRASNRR